MLEKSFLQGSPLVGVPICSNHWLHHHHLPAACLLFLYRSIDISQQGSVALLL